MIKPSTFNDKDSAIHNITVVGFPLDIVLLDGNMITQRGLENPKCKKFWFLIELYNEGKNPSGKFIKSGHYDKHKGEWIWVPHHYLINSDFNLYHYFYKITDNWYWNLKDNHIVKPFNSPYPTLGQKNVIKIKTALKRVLCLENQ